MLLIRPGLFTPIAGVGENAELTNTIFFATFRGLADLASTPHAHAEGLERHPVESLRGTLHGSDLCALAHQRHGWLTNRGNTLHHRK
jgi:hypothetical protein